jgi:predicted N-acetyltransferase YhbS
MTSLIPLTGVAPELIELLLDAAFGEDRHGRTAYRLREGSSAIDPLSFAIMDGLALIASIQCWPVRVGDCKLVLVGPVAVDPNRQNEGHGRTLMHAMLEAAIKIGNPPMTMIGDPEYYGRFGFTDDLTRGWTLPGPWEPRRLLVRNVTEDKLPETGMLERADAL